LFIGLYNYFNNNFVLILIFSGGTMSLQISTLFTTLTPSATLAMNERAKDMVKSGVEDLLFFTVGEPDFNSPDNVISAMKQALDKGFTGYTPTAGIPELRSAIAEKLKKDNNIDALPQEIMVSTGAKQALYNVTAAITNPGDEFIIPLPYWVSYPEIVKLCGGVNVFAGSPDRIEITLDDIIKKVTPKTKALILNSPSNPSGYVIPPKTIEQIAGYAREKDFYIISDEIYEKLIFRGVHFSPASIMKDRVSPMP
jgi:aspartate aminotransferase